MKRRDLLKASAAVLAGVGLPSVASAARNAPPDHAAVDRLWSRAFDRFIDVSMPWETGDPNEDIIRRMIPKVYRGTPMRSMFRCMPVAAIPPGANRRFKCVWGEQVTRDLQVVHGLDARDELSDILAEEVGLEITRLGLNKARLAASKVPATLATFADYVRILGNLTQADYILTNPESACLLERAGMTLEPSSWLGCLSIRHHGTFHGVEVYVDPLYPAGIQALSGRRYAVEFHCSQLLKGESRPSIGFDTRHTGLTTQSEFHVTHPDRLVRVVVA